MSSVAAASSAGRGVRRSSPVGILLTAFLLGAGACDGDFAPGNGSDDGGAVQKPATDASTDAPSSDGGGTRIDSTVDGGRPNGGAADAGWDGGTRDAGGTEPSPPDASVNLSGCPAGSFAAPKLSGLTLTRVSAVPIRDGFAAGWGIVEGPVWAGDALLVSHFGSGATPASRLYRVDASGNTTVAANASGTNGLALGRDGRLYGASHAVGGIVSFDLAHLDAAPKTVVASYDGARLNSPNDLTIRSDGTIYFTDPDYQAPSTRPQRASRVYRVSPSRAVEVIDATLSQPNGIALSLDERTLYVGSQGGLFRFPLSADGTVSGARAAVAAVTNAVDGLGRDCAGDLYVAGNDRVTVLDASERVIGTLSVVGATNIAFGGADRRTLYVTALGDPPMLMSVKLDVPGLSD